MMASFQTVVFLKSTGRIINIQQNRYIKNQADKRQFCGGYEPGLVGFTYFKHTLTIDPDVCRVRMSPGRGAPVICDDRGVSLLQSRSRDIALKIINSHDDIIVVFEGGMGDQLMQAAAVIEADRIFPGKSFYCKVRQQYLEVMQCCKEIDVFVDPADFDIDVKSAGEIVMTASLPWDPRGKLFGKADMYGSFLGLDSVPYETTLDLPPDMDERQAQFGSSIGIRTKDQNILMQLCSASGDNKSWPRDKAQRLAKMIKAQGEYVIFYLGRAGQEFPPTPFVVDLIGKTSWMDVCWLLHKAARIVCVDSAVLHLCKALSLDYTCLWGGSTPAAILGRDPDYRDICIPCPAPGGPDMVNAFDQICDIDKIEPHHVCDKLFPPATRSGSSIWARESVRLNLGCGADYRHGYINIDARADVNADLLSDISVLSEVPEAVADEIFAHDCLEHLPFRDIRATLKLWFDVLKPGGSIEIQVPDFDQIFEIYNQYKHDFDGFSSRIFGAQDYPLNRHLAAFCKDSLIKLMSSAGFVGLVSVDRSPGSPVNYALIIQGRRPEAL